MKIDIPKDWCINMANMEDGQEVGAGLAARDPLPADKNLQIANAILIDYGMDPNEHWKLADAIRCALTDVAFETMFGSDNPTLKLTDN